MEVTSPLQCAYQHTTCRSNKQHIASHQSSCHPSRSRRLASMPPGRDITTPPGAGRPQPAAPPARRRPAAVAVPHTPPPPGAPGAWATVPRDVLLSCRHRALTGTWHCQLLIPPQRGMTSYCCKLVRHMTCKHAAVYYRLGLAVSAHRLAAAARLAAVCGAVPAPDGPRTLSSRPAASSSACSARGPSVAARCGRRRPCSEEV